MTRLLSLALMLGLCVLGACGGDDGDGGDGGGSKAPTVVGTWSIDAKKLSDAIDAGIADMDKNSPQYQMAKGMAESMKQMFASMKCGFADDGTCWMQMGEDKKTGTYTCDGDQVTIKEDGESGDPVPPFTLKGDELIGKVPAGPGKEQEIIFRRDG